MTDNNTPEFTAELDAQEGRVYIYDEDDDVVNYFEAYDLEELALRNHRELYRRGSPFATCKLKCGEDY